MTIPVLVWLILGICFFLLEMVMPGFIVAFFGLGAWITAITCWLVVPLTLNGQLALFLVVSVVSLFALRGFIQRTFMGGSSQNEVVDSIVSSGDTAEVRVAIVPPAEGKVMYTGTLWRATADREIPVGEVVTILSQDGLLMHVAGKDSK